MKKLFEDLHRQQLLAAEKRRLLEAGKLSLAMTRPDESTPANASGNATPVTPDDQR